MNTINIFCMNECLTNVSFKKKLMETEFQQNDYLTQASGLQDLLTIMMKVYCKSMGASE